MDKLTNIICWLQPRRAEIFKVETIFTLEQLFFMDGYFKNLGKNTTMRKSMSEAFFRRKSSGTTQRHRLLEFFRVNLKQLDIRWRDVIIWKVKNARWLQKDEEHSSVAKAGLYKALHHKNWAESVAIHQYYPKFSL